MEEAVDIEKLVKEYMARFYKSYRIPRHGIEGIELWCRENLGTEYKDWTLYKGHHKDPHASLSIIDPKWCTIFELKFSDYIIESVDRKPS